MRSRCSRAWIASSPRSRPRSRALRAIRACGFRSSSAGPPLATRRGRCDTSFARAIRSTLRCPRRGSFRSAEGARDLPASAVFVSYLRDGDRVLAFTLDRRGRLQGRDLGALPGLDEWSSRTGCCSPHRAAATLPPVWRLPDGRYRVALAAEPGAVRVTDAAMIGAELTERLVEPLPELMRHAALDHLARQRARAGAVRNAAASRPAAGRHARDQLCAVADGVCAHDETRTRVRPALRSIRAVRDGRRVLRHAGTGCNVAESGRRCS